MPLTDPANRISIETIQNTVKLKKRWDKLVVWRELMASCHLEAFELKNLDTAEKIIHKSKEFKEWCNTHRDQLKKIQEIDLSEIKLSYLPKEIGILQKLKTLNLSHNNLSSLPEELKNLVELETLNIAHNKFCTLPLVVCKLANLNILRISGNSLSFLPQEIGNLSLLQELYVRFVPLRSLPREMSQLFARKDFKLIQY